MNDIVQTVLRAARVDIVKALGLEEVDRYDNFAILHKPLLARDFAKALFIARRAETVACADERSDLTQVLTKAMDELESKAPHMYAAIRDALLGGNVLLQRKYAQLEADHARVRAGAEFVLGAAERALTSGNSSQKYLGSGETENGSALARENSELERDAETLRKLTKVMPRDPSLVAETEIDDENEKLKEPPLPESIERPRQA